MLDLLAQLTRCTDETLAGLLDGSATDAARARGHRGLMTMVRTAVVCYLHEASRWHGEADVLEAAGRWLAELEDRQSDGDGGLFSSGDNLASPPDSSFTINDVAHVRRLLVAATDPVLVSLRERLAVICAAITPALVGGGVHTPNHRWEISAALARLHELEPQPEVLARIEQWLAEGIDVDADGLYSERSANYAAHVSNPSLIVLARVLDQPDLLEIVHRNLHAQIELTDPDGVVETVFSRRQDQKSTSFGVGRFLMQFRRFAVLTGCADCAAAARLAATDPEVDPVAALTEVLAEPVLGQDLPAGEPAPLPAERHFGGIGLVLWRRGTAITTVYGGSDVPRAGRIASGLACNPTFLRFRAGAAVLESVRLSRDFFGLGPFRSEGLRLADGAAHLREDLTTGYYQPVPAAARRHGGDYALEFEGRFAAAMAFSERDRDEVSMCTELSVRPTGTGIDLDATFTGPATAYAFELTFRPGGEFEGVQDLGADRHELSGGVGRYRVGADVITFGPGTGSGPDRLAEYHPGEAYTFLNGTDALAGPRVYLTGRTPGRAVLTIDG